MFKSIFVPVDLNQESSWKKTIPVAVKLAKEEGARIQLFTVIPDYGMAFVGSFFPAEHSKNVLAETSKELKNLAKAEIPPDVEHGCDVRHGTIYKEILKAAEKLECDLIVLSSHRPETKDYLLGPNAARVVRHANQSVFVIRD